MRFAQRAGPTLHEREEETLEEGGRLVERFFQRIVEVHVQLTGFVDVGADAVEDYVCEEALGYVAAGGDEDPRGFEAGVWGPVFGLGYGEEDGVLGEGGEDFEGFGEFAGSVAGEELADSIEGGEVG